MVPALACRFEAAQGGLWPLLARRPAGGSPLAVRCFRGPPGGMTEGAGDTWGVLETPPVPPCQGPG